jgi:pseudouridine-5'-phosphate glycosidase
MRRFTDVEHADPTHDVASPIAGKYLRGDPLGFRGAGAPWRGGDGQCRDTLCTFGNAPERVTMRDVVRIAPDVAEALRSGRPVVALESSVFAQGLPIPANREAAQRMVAAVRRCGALPAITAVVAGEPVVGVTEGELERLLRRDGVVKVSARDIPLAMARGLDGATTVAGALMLAQAAGIRVFATGGVGGVHRDVAGSASVRDESADLLELTRVPVVVVCSGAKAVLDLEGTVERLETLGVPVIGYRTAELPGFFTAETGIALPVRADSAVEIAAAYRAQRALGRPQALLVLQPPPEAAALSREVVDRAVVEALDRARRDGVRGGEVTPYLLRVVEQITEGRSVETNLALLERNAALAAEIAREVARAGEHAERPERSTSRGVRPEGGEI